MTEQQLPTGVGGKLGAPWDIGHVWSHFWLAQLGVDTPGV